MADNEPSDAAIRGQLLPGDILGYARNRLSGALDSIRDEADGLRGLALTLEEGSVSFGSRERVLAAAAAARAAATRVQAAALTLAECGERLVCWRDVVELVGADDSEPGDTA